MNALNKDKIKSCLRCGLDYTIASIRFDNKGICNFCISHDLLIDMYPRDEKILANKRLDLIKKIKHAGRNNRYDCIEAFHQQIQLDHYFGRLMINFH